MSYLTLNTVFFGLNEAFTNQFQILHVQYSKVNKQTQELIQSDPHQAPNTKGKDRQIQ